MPASKLLFCKFNIVCQNLHFFALSCKKQEIVFTLKILSPFDNNHPFNFHRNRPRSVNFSNSNFKFKRLRPLFETKKKKKKKKKRASQRHLQILHFISFPLAYSFLGFCKNNAKKSDFPKDTPQVDNNLRTIKCKFDFVKDYHHTYCRNT